MCLLVWRMVYCLIEEYLINNDVSAPLHFVTRPLYFHRASVHPPPRQCYVFLKSRLATLCRLPENSLALLTDAYIYLGDGFSFSVLDSSVSSHVGFALSRYEDSTCTTLRRGRGFCDCRMYDNCHDSYVFRSPLPHSLVQGNTTDFRLAGFGAVNACSSMNCKLMESR